MFPNAKSMSRDESVVELPSIAVVLVNWNSGKLLQRCLGSLQRQSLLPGCIYIVDNNSQDDSLDCLQQYPDLPLTLLRQSNNLGFAGANNRAIELAHDFELIALLNVDAEAAPDWLYTTAVAAKNLPEYGSFASCMLMTERPLRYDGAGDIYHVTGIAWRRFYRRRFLDEENSSDNVFAPCAGAAVYRRSALLEVGLFDEDFFCYFEDVDLGFRLQLAGYPCRYVSNAMVNHIGGGLVKQAAVPIYYGHRNLVLTYWKDMPLLLAVVLLPLHLLMNLVCVLVYCAKGHGSAIFRAKYDAIKMLPQTFAKRGQVSRRAGYLTLLSRMQWLPRWRGLT